MKYIDTDLILAIIPVLLLLVGLGFYGGTLLGIAIVILSWPFAAIAGFSFGCWMDTHFT
jgi:ABC-type dipeptide/oligopeptide/nickel transport system permease subunit